MRTAAVIVRMSIESRKFSSRKRFAWPKRNKANFLTKTQEGTKNEALPSANNYFSFQLIFYQNFLSNFLLICFFYFILILICFSLIITTEYLLLKNKQCQQCRRTRSFRECMRDLSS